MRSMRVPPPVAALHENDLTSEDVLEGIAGQKKALALGHTYMMSLRAAALRSYGRSSATW
jgi:hypothetical protein